MTDQNRTVQPCRRVAGRLAVPGDKSVSHRVAMLGGLASGESRIHGFLRSEDCLNTLRAMEALGARVADDGDCITVTGTGGRLVEPAGELDMGNSGTGLRLMAGLLAGQSFATCMTGDASLCSRPMGRIRDPLLEMGAAVELLGDGGCAPLRVGGGRLRPIHYAPPMASAQVKSCVLLAGLYARGETSVTESKPTRDHTERLLAAMGADIRTEGLHVTLSSCGEPRLSGGDWRVPGDLSSAAFWLAAAAMLPGSDVTIEHVGLNPRRTAFLDVLRRMGADLVVEAEADAWEPHGRIRVRSAPLHGTVVEGEEIPNLIDELPLVAVLAALADGRTEIRDARELRVKESDRIATVARNLAAMGVAVEEREDGLCVTGRAGPLPGGVTVESYGDHRIAMGMSVLSLCCAAPVVIANVGCVDTSYPQFWEHLEALVETV